MKQENYNTINPFDYGFTIEDVELLFELNQ